jgi:Fic family protein
VRGPQREVAEVKNAIAAYDLAPSLDAGSQRDLLRAHGVLMAGLAADAGRYRRGNVGVLAGSRVAHVAPKAARVPGLMADLLAFAATDRTAPLLVRACVVHYEIEFIHPFSDGNGRMGRLWQHAMLRGHSPVFEHLPTESLIKQHQAAYYDALAAADRSGNADSFVLFMLERLRESLAELVETFRPVRPDAGARLSEAALRFGREAFSRKDYLVLHKGISAPTASRDLRVGVERGLLRMRGEKATARYEFASGAATAAHKRARSER